jgi:hypothetical protein
MDVPAVNELGKELPNGGGVVKIDSDLQNGHPETNGQDQKAKVEQQEPSDDEEEEEQPEAAEIEEIGSKDMYLDAVSNGQGMRPVLCLTDNLCCRSRGPISTLISSVSAQSR